jgi:hypothetical protein
VSTTSSIVLGAALIAAALALGLTWPRPNPAAGDPPRARPVTPPSAGAPPAVGRYQLYHVPVFFQQNELGATQRAELVGRQQGVKVYVLDTQTGRLLTEYEAKAIKAGE